ncbi:MAG: alpha-ketoglutaric semialdehyde dehydrogenase [Rhodothermales bacterium]|jgi:alpha-ketoglutaric semialdehyde dehydrogenase
METILLSGANFIAGREESAGAEVIYGVNPATGATLEPGFHEATPGEVLRAVTEAEAAFRANAGKGAEDRASLLEAIAQAIEDAGDTLVNRVMEETGLPEGRVRGERGRTMGQLRLFANVLREGSWVEARIETALPDRAPIPRPDLRNMLVPTGPVAVFGASNFPLAFSVAGGDTASALAAGCPVVCKAHPAHPGTSELVGRAINAAVLSCGFHPGTFSLVHGAGAAVGTALVEAEGITAVGFTGSLVAGRALFNAAAARPNPIPVFAEMGSVNPVFMLSGALADRSAALAAGLAGSVTMGSGQFCTNPGLVFATKGPELDPFLEELKAAIGGVGSQTMLHGGIASSYKAGLGRVNGTPGVNTLASGMGADVGGAASAPARIFVTDAATFRIEPHLHQEVFGPTSIVVACESVGEMISLVNLLEGNLTGTVHMTAAEAEEARPLLKAIEGRVGRVVVNGFPTGVEVSHSMQHGGPYPATTAPGTTSVGTAAIRRFVRPVCLQDYPAELLPVELRDDNPRGILRQVNGQYTHDAI